MRTPKFAVLALMCAIVMLLSTAPIATAAIDPDVDWSATFGGSDDEWANSVRQTSDGGYILAGGRFAETQNDVLLIKTDASGTQQWSRTYGGSGWDDASAVIQTADGGYVVAGTNESVLPGKSKGWLFKTDALGAQVWSKTFGGGDWDHFDSVLQTPDGGYVVSGFVDSMGDLDGDLWSLKIAS